MKIRNIADEVFQDYYKISMLIGTCFCDFKCLKDLGKDISICQNSELYKTDIREIENDVLIKRFNDNSVTEAIIFGGLEPIIQIDEIEDFISLFRKTNENDVLIYTGYYPYEIEYELDRLTKYKNILFKFGRFIPNGKVKYDNVLKTYLSSENQYGCRLS